MDWVESLAGAVLVPMRSSYNEPPRRAGGQGRMVYDGGVYDAAGRPVDRARHIGGNTLNQPAPALPEEPAETLAGTWLFGGWLRPHFGHFVNESLGRLWAWPEASGEAPRGILFLPFGWQQGRDPGSATSPADRVWLPEFLHLLGIAAEIRVVTAPLRVARLIVPSQRLLEPDPGDPEGPAIHRQAMHRALAHLPASAVRRAYVSRDGLAPPLSSFVLESLIETNLAGAGYAVLRPETLSIAAQIAAYAGLEDVIFAEGSAVHLAELFLPPRARLGMLWRIGARNPRMFRRLATTPLALLRDVSAVQGVVVSIPATTPEGSLAGVQWRNAHPVPDFAWLGQELVASGFVPAGSWQVPDAAVLDAAIEARLALLRRVRPGLRHAYIPAEAMPAPWRRIVPDRVDDARSAIPPDVKLA